MGPEVVSSMLPGDDLFLFTSPVEKGGTDGAKNLSRAKTDKEKEEEEDAEEEGEGEEEEEGEEEGEEEEGGEEEEEYRDSDENKAEKEELVIRKLKDEVAIKYLRLLRLTPLTYCFFQLVCCVCSKVDTRNPHSSHFDDLYGGSQRSTFQKCGRHLNGHKIASGLAKSFAEHSACYQFIHVTRICSKRMRYLCVARNFCETREISTR